MIAARPANRGGRDNRLGLGTPGARRRVCALAGIRTMAIASILADGDGRVLFWISDREGSPQTGPYRVPRGKACRLPGS
jgi:hypothetical protein